MPAVALASGRTPVPSKPGLDPGFVFPRRGCAASPDRRRRGHPACSRDGRRSSGRRDRRITTSGDAPPFTFDLCTPKDQPSVIAPFLAVGFYYSHPINEKQIVFSDDGDTEVLLPDRTLGACGNLGVRIPLREAGEDSPRSAILLAYRFVVASHHEYSPIGLFQERVTSVCNLGVVSFDLVMRKHLPESGGDLGRWKIH